MDRRRHEFDALIAASLALAVTLGACWALAQVVPAALAAEGAAARLEASMPPGSEAEMQVIR